MATPTVQPSLKQKYEKYYNTKSNDLARWRDLGSAIKGENIKRLCSHHPHQAILEIGCGDGAILQRLDQEAFAHALYGIDISKSGIDILQTRDISALAEAKQFDGYKIPYADNNFDLAVLSHVIEHVEHPRLLLTEAARVSRRVFVEVPLEHTIRLKRDYDFNEVGHINFFSAKTFRRLIQTTNLRVLDQIVTETSKEMLVHTFGSKGIPRHLIRKWALRLVPSIAQRVFVYHSAILCEPIDVENA